MLSDECKNRLYNWEFNQAFKLLRQAQATDNEAALVRSLSLVFGDIGHQGGNMAEIVRGAVAYLIGDDYEEELLPDPYDEPGAENGPWPIGLG